MVAALRCHWPEYLMEAAGLGTFMVSACAFGTLLEHPASPVRRAIDDVLLRRACMGVAMGLTAIALVYSPWGRRSGAHLNPSFTLSFLQLGKVQRWDAAFYVLAQFGGAAAAVALMTVLLGPWIGHPAVNYVVTAPGPWGASVAFGAEVAISLVMMATVLVVSNTPGLAGATGLVAGTLVALYITVEAPLSGMSMNPARTFASALAADAWTAIWAYFVAPPIGMLLASQLYVWSRQRRPVMCAKLHHDPRRRCIFRCGYAAARRTPLGLEETHA
jgi:aquaporin Z